MTDPVSSTAAGAAAKAGLYAWLADHAVEMIGGMAAAGGGMARAFYARYERMMGRVETVERGLADGKLTLATKDDLHAALESHRKDMHDGFADIQRQINTLYRGTP